MPPATGKAALLLWAQRETASFGVPIKNFSESWGDGLAFCALIARFTGKIDFASLNKADKARNVQLAFDVATSLGVPPLLDAEDMLISKPEPLSVCTYVAQLYHILPAVGNAENAGTKTQRPVGGLAGVTPSGPQVKATTATSQDKKTTSSVKRKSLPKPAAAAVPVAKAKVPLCSKCGKALTGCEAIALSASGVELQFHPACFQCSSCNKNLDKRPVVVEGKPFCEPCGRTAFVAARAGESGAVSKVACGKCEALNSAGSKFCSGCGTNLPAAPGTCGKCGAQNRPASKFCSGCGNGLAQSPAVISNTSRTPPTAVSAASSQPESKKPAVVASSTVTTTSTPSTSKAAAAATTASKATAPTKPAAADSKRTLADSKPPVADSKPAADSKSAGTDSKPAVTNSKPAKITGATSAAKDPAAAVTIQQPTPSGAKPVTSTSASVAKVPAGTASTAATTKPSAIDDKPATTSASVSSNVAALKTSTLAQFSATERKPTSTTTAESTVKSPAVAAAVVISKPTSKTTPASTEPAITTTSGANATKVVKPVTEKPVAAKPATKAPSASKLQQTGIAALAGQLQIPVGGMLTGPPPKSRPEQKPKIVKLEHITKSRPSGAKGRAAPTLRRRRKEISALERAETERLIAQQDKAREEREAIERARKARETELERTRLEEEARRAAAAEERQRALDEQVRLARELREAKEDEERAEKEAAERLTQAKREREIAEATERRRQDDERRAFEARAAEAKAEAERVDREERQRKVREARELERAKREAVLQAQRQQREKERAERRARIEKDEQDLAEKRARMEQAQRERAEKEALEQRLQEERLQREQEERERIEEERIAREREEELLEQQRIEKECRERELQEQKKLEAQRLAAEKELQERVERERKEEEARIAREAAAAEETRKAEQRRTQSKARLKQLQREFLAIQEREEKALREEEAARARREAEEEFELELRENEEALLSAREGKLTHSRVALQRVADLRQSINLDGGDDDDENDDDDESEETDTAQWMRANDLADILLKHSSRLKEMKLETLKRRTVQHLDQICQGDTASAKRIYDAIQREAQANETETERWMRENDLADVLQKHSDRLKGMQLETLKRRSVLHLDQICQGDSVSAERIYSAIQGHSSTGSDRNAPSPSESIPSSEPAWLRLARERRSRRVQQEELEREKRVAGRALQVQQAEREQEKQVVEPKLRDTAAATPVSANSRARTARASRFDRSKRIATQVITSEDVAAMASMSLEVGSTVEIGSDLFEAPPTRPIPPSVDAATTSEEQLEPRSVQFVEDRGEERASLLEGWLWKRDSHGVIKQWRKRWCAVIGEQLLYWKSPQQTVFEHADFEVAPGQASLLALGAAVPLGSVSLREVALIDPAEEPVSGRPFVFRVIMETVAGAQLEYAFSCDDELSAMQWSAGLTQAVIRVKVSPPESASDSLLDDNVLSRPSPTNRATAIRPELAFKEGILEIKQGLIGSWKKVFVVLQGGVFLFMDRKTGKRKGDKLALYRCKLEEHEPGKHDNRAFKITAAKGGRAVILRAEKEEQMHYWLNSMMLQKVAIEDVIDQITA